ncbi:aquaporin-4 [Vanacampus margaritifer]
MPGVQSQGTIGGSQSAIRSTQPPSSVSTMLGVENMKSKDFWRAVAAEFLAMLLFVFICTGSAIDWNSSKKPPTGVVHVPDTKLFISISFGLTIATLVQCFGHISGAHINPAVTAAMFVTKKVTPIKGLFYFMAQLVGAIAGSGIVLAVTPAKLRENGVGVSMIDENVGEALALLVELLLTFQLVFTIFATCDSKRTDLGGSASLAIGLSVMIGHLIGIPFSGASMNPARTFGPAVIYNKFAGHWVYWVGPMLGGVIAALVYEFIFCPDSGKPSPGQVIPKNQTGTYKDMEGGSMQPLKKKRRTERKDPPPTRDVLSTV